MIGKCFIEVLEEIAVFISFRNSTGKYKNRFDFTSF
jgi:hypothetical protein